MRRAPLRLRRTPFTTSRWMSAPRRPRRVVKPSASIPTMASNLARARERYGQARRTSAYNCASSAFACRNLGDDLLRQHVQRLIRDRKAVEFTALAGLDQRRAFDQIVARERK